MKLLESILPAFIQLYMSADESFMDIMSADEKLQTTTEENKRTPCSSVCPDALTSGDPDGRMISARRRGGKSSEMLRWPSRFTSQRPRRSLSAPRERGSLRIIRLSVSYWPSVQLTFSMSHKHIKRRRRPVIATARDLSTHMCSKGCRTNA